MKLIKITVTVIILLQSFLIKAQEYSFISKDLHLMNEQEMIDNAVQFSSDTVMYDEQGNTIEPSQINDLMTSENFVPMVYGNKDHEAQAIVFRTATDKEKIAVKKANAKDPNANFIPGQFANNFTTTDIDGNAIVLNDLKGKVVVLNFWYSNCNTCVADMPELNKLVDKHTDVVFIGITFDSKEEAEKILKTNSFKYTVVPNQKDVLINYETIAFPTHIIIDKNGEIVFRKIGTFVKEMDEKLAILTK